MRSRSRTPESTVQVDRRTGESFIHLEMKIDAIWRDAPQDAIDDRTRHYIRLLDEKMAEAIYDLVQRYWIPVPPIQSRVTDRGDRYAFGGQLSYALHERRIRVLKPQVIEATQLDNPGLKVAFFTEWDSYDLPPWRTYLPEYDDAEVDAPKDRQARPPASSPDREGAGADAAPQLPAR